MCSSGIFYENHCSFLSVLLVHIEYYIRIAFSCCVRKLLSIGVVMGKIVFILFNLTSYSFSF